MKGKKGRIENKNNENKMSSYPGMEKNAVKT